MIPAGIDLNFMKAPPRFLQRPKLGKLAASCATSECIASAAKWLRGDLCDRFMGRWLGRMCVIDRQVPSTAATTRYSGPPMSNTESTSIGIPAYVEPTPWMDEENLGGVRFLDGLNLRSDFTGLSPLHQSCIARNPRACKAILEVGGASPDHADAAGLQPVFHAVAAESTLCLRHLLSAGAKTSVVTPTQMTPLTAAVEGGSADIVAEMLSWGADASIRANHDMTPLHYARSPHIAGLLLAAGAAVDQRNRHGWTALMAAAYVGDIATAKLLLEVGAAFDAPNRRGETPLMLAAACGAIEVATLLLDAGADADACSARGLTPLHCAGILHDPSCFVHLFARGASIGCSHHCISCTSRLQAVCHLVPPEAVKYLPAPAADLRRQLLRSDALRMHRKRR